MKQCICYTLLALLLAWQPGFGQEKFFPSKTQKEQIRKAGDTGRAPTLLLPETWEARAPATPSGAPSSFRPASMPLLAGREGKVTMTTDSRTGLPIMVKGALRVRDLKFPGKTALENQLFSYLSVLKTTMQIERPEEEFVLRSVSTDEIGYTHVRLQQVVEGVEVYGAEVGLHLKGGEVRLFVGRYYPSPVLPTLAPKIPEAAAVEVAWEDLASVTPHRTLTVEEQRWTGGPPVSAQLVIYHPEQSVEGERLAWALTLTPNVSNRWAYFVDAQTGAVLEKYSLLCRLHYHEEFAASGNDVKGRANAMPSGKKADLLPADGPRTVSAIDLLGQNRTIDVYESDRTFYLLDISREMFDPSRSDLPGDPTGAIWTIDARNTSPDRGDFSVVQVTSRDNRWNPVAVSAHYNAGRAYEYFRNTFGRNSISGQGDNIISIINVTDELGEQMDNAFWNGAAMFYGNGDRLFSAPLAKALDVAAHEMSHGVIQNTAGLEYQGESGAINESFADVFGVLIDRDDWTIGEEVVDIGSFRSGALRDMANPNNGGRRLGDRGWQPASTDEQYFGRENNGGVHINSGIPNRAFFLFASQVGREIAEQVYYRALDRYLLRSSQFIDLRIAVLQASSDLYDDSVAEAAATAFDAVGIVGSQGGNYQQDVEPNPGEDLIFYTDPSQRNLFVITPEGQLIANPLYSRGIISRPSVTDDGSLVVFVGADRHIHFILIDWATRSIVDSGILSSSPEWRNVAVSRDGNRLAGLVGSFSNPASLDDKVYVFDLTTRPITSRAFRLYNPTTAPGGIQTGDVLFADRLEWDFSGSFVLYDAFNSIPFGFGNSIDYWDIGFLHAWDEPRRRFGDGAISKLFTGLSEGVTVGNPTFSKNSPYIIAFDYTRDNNSYDLLGVNIQTQEVGLIFEGNPVPGAPSFATDDDVLIFDARTGTNRSVVAFRQLNADKISGRGNTNILFDNASNGVWFATGQRDISTHRATLIDDMPVQFFPNPFSEVFQLRFTLRQPRLVRLELFDLAGRRVYAERVQAEAGLFQHDVDGKGLSSGAYILRISAGAESVSYPVFKN